MTRVLALADHSKIGCITQRRFAKVGTKTHPQRGAALDRNGLSVSTETACRFEPKSPVGNSETCKKRRYAGRRPVSIGIGIHYGQVLAGVIEGGKRLEFTVIGDAVNTTHRIEELTKTAGWSLLVSAELLGAAKPPCPSRDCHPLPAQIVRGLKEPLQLFALVSADEPPKPAYG
jgi:class 3 adenylate cyclase